MSNRIRTYEKRGDALSRMYGACRTFARSPYKRWSPTIRSERVVSAVCLAARGEGKDGE